MYTQTPFLVRTGVSSDQDLLQKSESKDALNKVDEDEGLPFSAYAKSKKEAEFLEIPTFLRRAKRMSGA